MSDRVVEAPRPVGVARLVAWAPWPFENPSLVGHASVCFPGGWTVSSIPVFRRDDGSLSAGVPSIPALDADGKVKLKADGKREYRAVLSFESGAARRRWNDLVLGALAAGVIVAGTAGNAPRLEPPC